MNEAQRRLNSGQVEAFYHDLFVTDQVADFVAIADPTVSCEAGVVVDVGGGCGYFAQAISRRIGIRTRVLDADPLSIETCHRGGVDAVQGDALDPPFSGDEHMACFNLILHHLVGGSESQTRRLQELALSLWRQRVKAIFVNEYIYESFGWPDVSGRLIYFITNSAALSALGKLVSRVIPSLKANTFGVGVRFRSHAQWRQLFESQGYEIVKSTIGEEERISLPRRLLLIKHCRRDSFLLRPRATAS